ncbi:MAG: hypothetical protein IJ691_10620 [Lachnospiraceae bacterium]|nr:hypothetical protein [Lachnospiraceae bacterium]
MSKLINKNIIKAMTIGISAVMATSSMNLSAFAANEGTEPETKEPVTQENAAVTKSALTETLENMGKVVEDKKVVDNELKDVGVKPSVEVAVDTYDVAVNASNDETLPVAVNKETASSETPAPDNKDENEKADLKEIASDIKEAISGTNGMISNSKDADTYADIANSQAEIANKAEEKAEGIVEKAENLLNMNEENKTEGEKTVGEKIDEADKTLDTERENISKAETVGEADEAMKNAGDAVTAADSDVKTLTEDFEKIESEFNAEKKKYDTAVGLYDTACANLKTAQDNLDSLKATASSDTAAAEEELERLAKEAATLKTNAEAAQSSYNEKGFAYIAALETEIENIFKPGSNGTGYWDKCGNLLKAILEFYYVPNLNEEDPTREYKFINTEWRIFGNVKDYTYENNGLLVERGSAINHCEVTYEVTTPAVVDEEGNVVTPEKKELVTKRFNFKGVDENKERAGGLVIFESVEHIVLDGHDLTEEELRTLNAAKDNIIVGNGYAIVKSGENEYSKYVLSDATGATDTQVTESNTRDKSGVGTTVEIGDESVSYSYELGENNHPQLVKTVTADVTTTTYTGATLSGQENSSRDEASVKAQFIADIKSKVGALTEGQSIVAGDFTFEYGKKYEDADYEAVYETVKTSKTDNVETTGFTVKGTYQEKEKFSKNIKGTVNHEIGDVDFLDLSKLIPVDRQEAVDAFNAEVEKEKAKYVYKDGSQQKYYLVGDVSTKDVSYTENKVERTNLLKPTKWVGIIPVEFEKEQVNKSVDYTGIVEGEYYTLSSQNVEYFAMIEGIKNIFDGKDSEKEQEDYLRELLAAEGKTLIHYDGWDTSKGFLGIGVATVYYIDAKNDTEGKFFAVSEAANAEAAKQAYVASYANDATRTNVRATEATAVTQNYTTYGYKALPYILKSASVAEAQTISTTAWSQASETSHFEYRNDNWYTGNILFAEYDQNQNTYKTDGAQGDSSNPYVAVDNSKNDEFRRLVAEANGEASKYTNLLNKIGEAQGKITAAQTEVDNLKTKLAELELEKADVTTINKWTASLEAAKKVLLVAQTDRDNLVSKLTTVTNEYNAKVDAIRALERTAAIADTVAPVAQTIPAAVTNVAVGDAGNAGAGNAAGNVAAGNAGAGNANAAGNAGAANNEADDADTNAADVAENTETIENEQSALAEGLTETKTENIGNELSALSEGIDTVNTKRNWNWWWIALAAAVTGGTTFGIIKGNQKKSKVTKKDK